MERPKRKTNRLENYDYSAPNVYFVTICTEKRKNLFWENVGATVIQQMKGIATKQTGAHIWQKSFHDHIVRGQKDYLKIWEYIETNPMKWAEDCFYMEDTPSRSTNG